MTETIIIDKLAWIFIKDRKILSTRSIGKDAYYIPGGKRENNESDSEALIREIKEELDVDLIPDTIKHMETFKGQAHAHPKGVLVKMTCYFSDFKGTLKPTSEIEEFIWFTHKDREKSSPVDKIIFDWLKEKDMID